MSKPCECGSASLMSLRHSHYCPANDPVDELTPKCGSDHWVDIAKPLYDSRKSDIDRKVWECLYCGKRNMHGQIVTESENGWIQLLVGS